MKRMDRNREGRRVTMAASNGLSRRRHRTSSLRESPEEDGPMELLETARLRDRGTVKKDRDRERVRDGDRLLSRSKRRRAERLMNGSNRENGGVDESTEESMNDEEEEDYYGGGGGAVERVGTTSMSLIQPNPSSLSSSSMSNHFHRKSFPPPSQIFKAPTPSPWRPTSEMIGVTVPRKARSGSEVELI